MKATATPRRVDWKAERDRIDLAAVATGLLHLAGVDIDARSGTDRQTDWLRMRAEATCGPRLSGPCSEVDPVADGPAHAVGRAEARSCRR